MRDISLNDTIYIRFPTRSFSTGAPITLSGSPVLSIYEENNLTQITTGVSVTVDYDGITGLNQATIVATSGNGYENGKSYDLIITTGTSSGVSVVGEVVGSFTIGSSAAAVDLANGTDGLGAIKGETATIVTDTNEIQGKLPTNKFMGSSDGADDDGNINSILTDTGTTLDTKLNDIQGGTFNGGTDSLEAIRDRGDAAWTTGAGGSDRLLMVDTTIATLTSQTSFTLTAGSADDDAYNNCTIVIEDVSTATQKAVGIVSDYTGSTKRIILKYDPAIFVMATTDKIYILAENALKASAANRQISVEADGDLTKVNLCDNTVLVDTTTTNTDMVTEPPTAVQNRQEMDSNSTQLSAIVTDTGEIGTAGAGLSNINLPNQTMDITGDLSGSVGSVTGAVGSVTGHTNQTGDNYAIVNGAAGLVAIDTVVDAIKAITDLLPDAGALNDLAAILTDTGTTLPATLSTIDTVVDGIQTDLSNGTDGLGALKTLIDAVDAVVDAIKVVTDRQAASIINGTASGTPTTTTMVSDITITVDDQFNGRIITFRDDTTTTALQGQQTDITGSAQATDTFTFTEIATAPVSGDIFDIT